MGASATDDRATDTGRLRRGGHRIIERATKLVAAWPREQRLFTAAVVLVAVHTVTDAFIAPEPGVPCATISFPLSPRSGSCRRPHSLLGAVAPDSLRSSPSLSAHSLSKGAALAVAHARAVGLGGDDWTGLALAPAGLTLLAIECSSAVAVAPRRPLVPAAPAHRQSPPSSARTGSSYQWESR